MVVFGDQGANAAASGENADVASEDTTSRNPSESTLGEQAAVVTDTAVSTRDVTSTYRVRQVASKTVVSFTSQDAENPRNWSRLNNARELYPQKWKLLVVFTAVIGVLNSTLGSALPSGAISYIADDFNIDNEEELVLPISLFLVGYFFGPILCGPLSESYGRKVVLVTAFILFMAFTLGCAVSPSWPSLLIFRLLVGVVASAPISTVGGLLADIHGDPRKRGIAMAYAMTATNTGPIVGPSISGFVSVVGWRWTFWVGLIFAGVSFPVIAYLPETYEPTILQRRARKLRKESGNKSIVAPIELEKRDIKAVITVTLARPIHMLARESIVFFTCLYLAFVYAIFFLYFQTYPVIFQDMYGMSTGVAGLMYMPIVLGASIACAISILWDTYFYREQARGVAWADIEEYRRLPLACIGGPLYVVSLFWLGWTANPAIHWVVPMLSGMTFGTGFMLIFIAMLNYLSDAYDTFSASAQSASSCTRSLFGAALPIAASPMFQALGVNWVCSMLAFISLPMSIVPFAFIKYGDRIRANSKFCQELKQLKEARRREDEAEQQQVSSTPPSVSPPSGPPPDEEKGSVARTSGN